MEKQIILTTINVDRELWKKLNILKREIDFKSINDLIAYFVERYERAKAKSQQQN